MPARRSAVHAPAGISPFVLLHQLRAAHLTGGHVRRGDVVPAATRSRYNTAARPLVGLGYVQAVLAALNGAIVVIGHSHDLARGRVCARSLSDARKTYLFSWTERTDGAVLGGFARGPTYQAALVSLAQLFVRHVTFGTCVQTEEVIGRYCALVRSLDELLARPSGETGWTAAQLETACADVALAGQLIGIADALYFAMRYTLGGELRPRDVVVVPAVDDESALEERLPGSLLVQAEPTRPRSEHDDTPAARDDAPESGAAVRDRSPDGSVAAPTPSVAVPVLSAAASTPPAAPLEVDGTHVERVVGALARGRRRLMLIGPTGTGKTTVAAYAAQHLGYGIELVQIDEGVDARGLVGSYRRAVAAPPAAAAASASASAGMPAWAAELRELLHVQQQTLAALTARDTAASGTATGEWESADGVLTRWARRAIAGERVLLILDELAHGHRSVVSTVMAVLNTHDRATIAAQGLPIPAGAEASCAFHLLDVWMTNERLVIPADRVAIVATANAGDRYSGLALDNPAFRRRWDGWLELGPYPAAVSARILGRQLALPPAAPLITALDAVAARVAEYDARTARLGATLDLATLIAWGQTTLESVRHGDPLETAFRTAARDIWIERLVPRKGSVLDPEVERDLSRMVEEQTPHTVAESSDA